MSLRDDNWILECFRKLVDQIMLTRVSKFLRVPFIPCLLFLSFAFSASAAVGQTTASPAGVVLNGVVKGKQNHDYLEVPFVVPPGVERLTVSFSYTGRQDHTILDLGMWDPDRFRGWSGGNKMEFTIGIPDATPSYLPGPIIPGTWNLVIGVANIRPDETAHYTAHVFFTRTGKAGIQSFAPGPLRTGARWYRGDLHMHTAHSDGSCPSLSGKTVPCPVFVMLEAAVNRGLDFVAITDHNTTSQYDAERELQPYFDQLLLIPGREMTTYAGHTNFYGSTDFLDFRIPGPGGASINKLFREAHQLGELVSINHPVVPDKACIGCAWEQKGTDMGLVNAIEAINGGNSGQNRTLHKLDIAFWEKQLNAGYRPTAVGGSDTHRPMEGTIGEPTTVVHADELSVSAILKAIRAGHVFVDLTSSRNRVLEVQATAGSDSASMGDILPAPAGVPVNFTIHVENCPGSKVRVVLDGKVEPALQPGSIMSADQRLQAKWTSDGKRHWIRADVLDTDGNLQLLGNPIYLNSESAQ